MSKTLSIRKIIACLMLGSLIAIPPVAQGQDWGDDSREDSEFSGRFRRGGRGGDFGGRGFGGRGGWDATGGDFGGRFGGGFEGGFGGGGGRWGGRGGFDQDDAAAIFGHSENSNSNSLPSIKPHERITLDLPATFVAGDQDGDGQIGLYEWRNWRRGDMAGFLALDHNGDGFLTPAELVKGPRSPAQTIASGLTPGLGEVNPAPAATTTTAASATDIARATNMFGFLDQNRNGTIETAEWAKSSKLKPQFEKAGIDLNVAMPKEDFVKHYLELNSPKS